MKPCLFVNVLTRVLSAAHAITPAAEVIFRGIPDRDDWFVCRVQAAGVILTESKAGPVDIILEDTLTRLDSMSRKIQAYSKDPCAT